MRKYYGVRLLWFLITKINALPHILNIDGKVIRQATQKIIIYLLAQGCRIVFEGCVGVTTCVK